MYQIIDISADISEDVTQHDKILKSIKKVILDLAPEAKIILFGSRARNDIKEYSDWDILILLPEKPDYLKVQQIRDYLYELELESGEIISSIVRGIDEWHSPQYQISQFYQNVMREAIFI